MLKNLFIQNLALAENVSVTFFSGLNVITGETGAGKSILVDALCLLRGGRADVSLIRTGHEQAIICGLFIVDYSSNTMSLLKESGLIYTNEQTEDILIKRILCKNGKHRQFINDIPVTLKTLQLISSKLIDISSQFDNQRLLEHEFHTFFLDEFSDCQKVFKSYKIEYDSVQQLIRELQELLHEQSLLLREQSLFEFERKQIEDASISIEEFEKIEAILDRGQKVQSAKNIVQDILNSLSESDINILSIIKQNRKNMERLFKIIPNSYEIQLCINDINNISLTVEDIIGRIDSVFREFDIDDQDFSNAENRIEIYNKILQKFGPKIQDVFHYKKKCDEFLEKIFCIAERIKNLENIIILHISECIRNARILSLTRKKNIDILSLNIEKELADLGMKKSRFLCILDSNEKNSQHESVLSSFNIPLNILEEFLRLNKYGFEKVKFLLGANLGQDPQLIEKVASGGELSRIMLAIKNVLFGGDDDMSVFIFDEIDTGISGNIAAKVGKKLLQFCEQSFKDRTRQAICITHLPQVASYANHHFIVSKEVVDDNTITRIVYAEFEMRVTEIATMLSGEKVTEESIEQARALMKVLI